MKDIKDKKQLIKAARIAKRRPGEQEFWKEVEDRMNIREKSMVKSREIRHS